MCRKGVLCEEARKAGVTQEHVTKQYEAHLKVNAIVQKFVAALNESGAAPEEVILALTVIGRVVSQHPQLRDSPGVDVISGLTDEFFNATGQIGAVEEDLKKTGGDRFRYVVVDDLEFLRKQYSQASSVVEKLRIGLAMQAIAEQDPSTRYH